MPTWKRRSVLAACAGVSTTGALTPIGSTAAEGTAGSAATTPSSGWVDDPEGWSSARGNAANSRYLPFEGEFPKPDTEAWRYELPGSESSEEARVAVVDGVVYARTGGEIHAIDAADGDRKWEADVDATGCPAVFDGTVYVTGDDHLTALSAAAGDLEWEEAFETDESLPDPTVAYETVYLVVDGALRAFDPADGSARWDVEMVDVHADDPHFESDEPEPAAFRHETVAVANGAVYAALVAPTFTEEHDGEENEVEFSAAFGAVDAETGDGEWGVAFTPPHAGGPVTEPILATGSSVNANLGGGEGEYTFDAETGDGSYLERNLQATTETASVVTYWDVNGTLRVFEDGTSWSTESDYSAWLSPIVVGDAVIADHSVYSADAVDYPENALVAFDVADGSDRWVVDFDEALSGAGGKPTAADANTIYLEADGELVALRASDVDPGDGDDGGCDRDCDEDGSGDGNGGEADPDEDAGSGGGGDDADGGNGDGEDDDGGVGDGNGTGGDDAGSDDGTDSGGDDSVPGFTTGAGVLGGAVTLEWLRRKAGVDGATGADEPAA